MSEREEEEVRLSHLLSLPLSGRAVEVTGCAGRKHRGRILAFDPVSNRWVQIVPDFKVFESVMILAQISDS